MRYVGEPVAAVFADDPYLAEDAAELVLLDIEELPAILSAGEEPGEFDPGWPTEPAIVRKGYGDVDAAFRCRPCRGRGRRCRSGGIPACRSRPAARSRVTTPRATCWSFTAPPRCRIGTATRSRECSAGRLRRCTFSRGMSAAASAFAASFIPKTCWSALLRCACAGPIKWIEDRREHLIAANHSRQQQHRVRAAVDRDGRILAIDRRNFLRSGRLHAHARSDRPRSRRSDAAGSLSRSGVPRGGPHPPDQQDAVRHLPCARPVRKHLRARAAARRHRRET